jgi:hypothetical protein
MLRMSLSPEPMTDDAQLAAICHVLVTQHQAHTILLYGSRADGSAGEDSDYDVAAFAPVAQALRIAHQQGSAYWDVWVYPQADLQVATPEALRLRGSHILLQSGQSGHAFLDRVEALYRAGPTPLAADEVAARGVWAHKMLARIGRGDAEGNYRRVWLLQALLEDYFHRRTMWFEGPKKALRWLQLFDPPAHLAYCRALQPGADGQTIAALVQVLVGPMEG